MRLNKHLYSLTSALFVSASLFAACARSGADTHSSLPEVAVYKSPTCGCCTDWVSHLEENGFAVRTTEMADVTPIKEDFGVPAGLRSCHTAIVDGYAVEGHVPADDIKRMLRERPEIAGIAVAGMPQGSPGMPGPNPQRYDVTAFLKDGRHFVFAKH